MLHPANSVLGNSVRLFLRCLAMLVFLPAMLTAQLSPRNVPAGIEQFNRALDSATHQMDNAATLALWEDDGVSLLPGTKPIVGKAAIAKFIAGVTADFPGGQMATFELQCFDVEVAGPWASEWCSEHQVVLLPGDKRFEGWGKMLLVLHRGADGRWRMKREMWNQAAAPEAGGH